MGRCSYDSLEHLDGDDLIVQVWATSRWRDDVDAILQTGGFDARLGLRELFVADGETGDSDARRAARRDGARAPPAISRM